MSATNATDLLAKLEAIGITDTALRFVGPLAQDADQVDSEASKGHRVCDIAADVDEIHLSFAKGIEGEIPNLRVKVIVWLEPGKGGWKLHKGIAALEASDRPVSHGDARVMSPWVSLKTRGVTYTLDELSDLFVPRYGEQIKALAALDAERAEHEAAHQAWTEDWRARWDQAGGQ